MSVETDLRPPGDRVVMLSGASRGIGAAIAKQLYADGYRLSLGVRDPASIAGVLGSYDDTRVIVVRYDAVEPDTSEQWITQTATTFGTIDALVNNAGILRQIDFDSGDEALLDEMWAVNTRAPFRLTRLALPYLRRAGHGRIINIASTDGKRYRDPSVSVGYAMTKHALVAMTHAARFAGWDDGVRATAICPGGVATELIANTPGVTAPANQLSPETVAYTVSTVLKLPTNASVAEMVINTRLESTI